MRLSEVRARPLGNLSLGFGSKFKATLRRDKYLGSLGEGGAVVVVVGSSSLPL